MVPLRTRSYAGPVHFTTRSGRVVPSDVLRTVRLTERLDERTVTHLQAFSPELVERWETDLVSATWSSAGRWMVGYRASAVVDSVRREVGIVFAVSARADKEACACPRS